MANKADKLVGTFDLQAQVYKKIIELKEKGYREEDMYVIAKDGANLDTLRDKTNANFSTEDDGEGWKGGFASLFSNDDTSTRANYTNIGEDTAGSMDYNRHVEEGKILLYVDSEFGGTHGRETTAENTTMGGTGLGADNDTGSEESLRLHEERLDVDKERVQTGEVNVGKHVVEDEQSVEVPVEREEVYVERRPVNDGTAKGTDSGLSGRDAYQEGDNIHIPVSEERLDVSKKDVVSEEIVVGKRKVKDTERVDETVRREEVDIDQDTNGRTGSYTDKDNPRGL